MQISKLLFHPHITLAATIAGAISCATICGSLIAALTPLSAQPGFTILAPYILKIDAFLGGVAVLATAVAGIGRSFIPLIDAGPTPAPSPTVK